MAGVNPNKLYTENLMGDMVDMATGAFTSAIGVRNYGGTVFSIDGDILEVVVDNCDFSRRLELEYDGVSKCYRVSRVSRDSVMRAEWKPLPYNVDADVEWLTEPSTDDYLETLGGMMKLPVSVLCQTLLERTVKSNEEDPQALIDLASTEFTS